MDTRTGQVVATITVSNLPNDTAQDSVVSANGQIWAIDHAAKAIVRIDPAAKTHANLTNVDTALASGIDWAPPQS